MAETPLSKSINGTQLKAEVGASDLYVTEDILHAEGCTQEELEDGLAAHTPDPDYGKPQEDRDLSALRAKAQDVFAGNSTFTAAQVQKILAGIVLRLTR